ncbi:MAG: CPBP family intramembrane glutamic endopeptidase [Acidobacteriaceae bacterium]
MDLKPAPPPAEDPYPLQQIQPPPSEPSTPPDHRSHIVYGPFGLRALWSLLIYFAMVGIVVGGYFFVIHQGEPSNHAVTITKTTPSPATTPSTPPTEAHATESLSAMIIGEATLFLAFFFISWVMAIIERRSLTVFGLGGTHPIRRFLTGSFWGLTTISLLILILHSLHLLVFDTLLDHGTDILYWGGLQLFGFLLVGLTEEYTMRGYLQFTLTRGMVSIGNRISPRHARTIGFWLAAVLTSALFLYLHTYNAGEDWLGLAQIFLAGVVFVVALWRTGSLWWGIGFHMAWDWGQSFLYGVPDSGGLMQGRLFTTHAVGKTLLSGGSVGPEGSIFCAPVCLLAILILFLTHPSPQPPLETEAEP